MKENKLPIPWIIKSKILKENKKYFFLIVILNSIAWILLGYKAGLINMIAKDAGLITSLIAAILLIFGTNKIIQNFIRLTNIDIYNGKINSEKSKEFFAFKDLFKDEKFDKYQQEILESIYNKKDKFLVLAGMFIIIIIALVNDIIYTNNFGSMYYEHVYPWTIIGYIFPNLIYWFIFISSLIFSLLWVLIRIIKGVELIGTTDNLKIVSLNIKEKRKADTISFTKFKSNIKPISNLVYIISIIIITFSFIYTSTVVYFTLFLFSNLLLYLFSFIFVIAGLAIFIYPQSKLHKFLNIIKKNMLLEYNQIHEDLKINYLNLINEHTKEALTQKEGLKNDMTVVKDIIGETEKLDTWPYNVTRIYKLIGYGAVSLIAIRNII